MQEGDKVIAGDPNKKGAWDRQQNGDPNVWLKTLFTCLQCLVKQNK